MLRFVDHGPRHQRTPGILRETGRGLPIEREVPRVAANRIEVRYEEETRGKGRFYNGNDLDRNEGEPDEAGNQKKRVAIDDSRGNKKWHAGVDFPIAAIGKINIDKLTTAAAAWIPI
jgi:hypothetical protein